MSVEIVAVQQLVRQAVNERQLSLNQIARMAGVTVPTVSRIYSKSEGTVHPKTAKAIKDALEGRSPSVPPKMIRGITKADESRIVDVVMRTLRKELRQLRQG